MKRSRRGSSPVRLNAAETDGVANRKKTRMYRLSPFKPR
jgi:hypothetical protein